MRLSVLDFRYTYVDRSEKYYMLEHVHYECFPVSNSLTSVYVVCKRDDDLKLHSIY